MRDLLSGVIVSGDTQYIGNVAGQFRDEGS